MPILNREKVIQLFGTLGDGALRQYAAQDPTLFRVISGCEESLLSLITPGFECGAIGLMRLYSVPMYINISIEARSAASEVASIALSELEARAISYRLDEEHRIVHGSRSHPRKPKSIAIPYPWLSNRPRKL